MLAFLLLLFPFCLGFLAFPFSLSGLTFPRLPWSLGKRAVEVCEFGKGVQLSTPEMRDEGQKRHNNQGGRLYILTPLLLAYASSDTAPAEDEARSYLTRLHRPGMLWRSKQGSSISRLENIPMLHGTYHSERVGPFVECYVAMIGTLRTHYGRPACDNAPPDGEHGLAM